MTAPGAPSVVSRHPCSLARSRDMDPRRGFDPTGERRAPIHRDPLRPSRQRRGASLRGRGNAFRFALAGSTSASPGCVRSTDAIHTSDCEHPRIVRLSIAVDALAPRDRCAWRFTTPCTLRRFTRATGRECSSPRSARIERPASDAPVASTDAIAARERRPLRRGQRPLPPLPREKQQISRPEASSDRSRPFAGSPSSRGFATGSRARRRSERAGALAPFAFLCPRPRRSV